VDRTDPLHPDQLSRQEFTVDQALYEHAIIKRRARHPGQEPGWPLIIDILRRAEGEYSEFNIVARAQYEKQRRFRDLTSRLDMHELENIKAADEAEGMLQNAWLVWRRVFATYSRIHRALSPNQPMPSAALAPPDVPEPWPSPAEVK
jgi:hypothetical protein